MSLSWRPPHEDNDIVERRRLWRPTSLYVAVIASRRRPVAVLPAMSNDPRAPRSRNWVSLVLRDVQFWIPVAVLIGGLFVLRWIH
jgi:hypothetical protein